MFVMHNVRATLQGMFISLSTKLSFLIKPFRVTGSSQPKTVFDVKAASNAWLTD